MGWRGGWSWKRALGVTTAKRRVSRAIGIPLTRSGRDAKLGRFVRQNLPLTSGLLVVAALLYLLGRFVR